MKHFKIEMENLLKDITNNVYLEQADDINTYPYLVYSINQRRIQDKMSYFTLYIDIWDKSGDTQNVDELERKVRNLDKASYIDNKIQFNLHYDRTLNVGSEDKQFKRYTVIFEVHLLERS